MSKPEIPSTVVIWKCDKCWTYILLAVSTTLFAIIFAFVFSYMPKSLDSDKLLSTNGQLDYEATSAYFTNEVNRLNHYIGIVSIMVALFGIFGSVVAIGMGISLSLKERGIAEELDKAKQEAVSAYEQAVNAKQEAKLEKDNLQMKFNQYILGTYILPVTSIYEDTEHAQYIEMFHRMTRSSICRDDEVKSLNTYVNDVLSKYKIEKEMELTFWVSNLISMLSFLMYIEITSKNYITNNKTTFVQILEMFLHGLTQSNVNAYLQLFHAFISRYVYHYTAISKVNVLQDIDDINQQIIQIFKMIQSEYGKMNIISQAAYEEFYRITGLPQST
ncbi:hypothetical protein PVA45_08615 (plasmid) [Entomospira entomophila]|uniref:Uncharacterized protein n=1 Tax=Entomospira entomophila TaxID=2719988 RepID=A0A968GAH0_9SPIO|nr:hypothetical protein [Entomospira entomophilus]NIZ41570.1 hypothetical protein [Entomospira entomophilus]WDI36455.1 hypothetical protein PVA45_08615 [Entomospira entomophilus]